MVVDVLGVGVLRHQGGLRHHGLVGGLETCSHQHVVQHVDIGPATQAVQGQVGVHCCWDEPKPSGGLGDSCKQYFRQVQLISRPV